MQVAPSLKIFQDPTHTPTPLRIGSRLDKYRLTGRLGEGGFATVYSATDLVEDRKVALKIPDLNHVTNAQSLDDLHREVRIMAKMEHPGILKLKDARFIDGRFVIAFPLGEETLADRLTRRLSRATAMDYAVQMISAVAYAHQKSVLHRDIKPENFVLFSDQVIQLTDFGLARVETGGHDLSGSGTLGFISPEQAMGKPTYRSDVFSLGLVIYRMFSGAVPDYPFNSLPAFNRFRKGVSRDFVSIIKKSIEPKPSHRFRDAVAMLNALSKIRYPLTDRSVMLTGDSVPSAMTRRAA
jgi:serine/threonine-protein kinase